MKDLSIEKWGKEDGRLGVSLEIYYLANKLKIHVLKRTWDNGIEG